MKEKAKENFRYFSIRFNKLEWETIQALKKRHGINISATIKIAMQKKLEELGGFNTYDNIN